MLVDTDVASMSEETREVLRAHLDRFKWKEAAVSTEQLRSPRWMIGTGPKASCPAELRRCLTVSEESQVLHMKLVIHLFVEACRRIRASCRARQRMSVEVFEGFADYSCMYASVLHEARQQSTWSADMEAQIMKSFFQKCLRL